LAHITQLVAADALTPGLTDCLPSLFALIADIAPDALVHTLCSPADGGDIGLLEGAAGTALALHAFSAEGPSLSGSWDSCFLTN
jgi:hypothetical protein